MLKRLPQLVLLAWALTVVGVRFVSHAHAAPPSQAQLDLLKNGEAQRVGTLDGGFPVTVQPNGAVYMVACGGACILCTFGTSGVSSSSDAGCDSNTGETFAAGEKRFVITGSSTTAVIPASACNCAVYRMK